MASGKRWALYASNHNVGTVREHRLAGARIGPFSCSVSYEVLSGWKFTTAWRPVHFEVGIPARGNKRQQLIEEMFRHPRFKQEHAESKSAAGRDFKAGRGYRMVLDDPFAPMPPLASWRPDDPVQPEGWHHNGQQWVLDEEGWSQDRSGYWRYTKPGDFGWVFRGTRWEYLSKDPSGQFISLDGDPVKPDEART